MFRTSVNSKTIMTFSILVIALASLFASGSILTNQQVLGAGGGGGPAGGGGHAGFVGSSSGL
jgi:hypothetical protein